MTNETEQTQEQPKKGCGKKFNIKGKVKGTHSYKICGKHGLCEDCKELVK